MLIRGNYVLTEDKTGIIDCRRTIDRITESIKSDNVLSNRLNELGCLNEYSQLETAVDAVLINAQNHQANFILPNEDEIQRMAR